MTLDLDELEWLARGAIAEKWTPYEGKSRSLRFISTATPAAVIALIARVRAAEARAERLRAALEHIYETAELLENDSVREALTADDAARGKGK